MFEASNDMCSLECHAGSAKNSRFSTIVDLSGFDMGNGAYKNLLGVNAVSAIGALFLFLFACCDDVLEWKLEEAVERTKLEEEAKDFDEGGDTQL